MLSVFLLAVWALTEAGNHQGEVSFSSEGDETTSHALNSMPNQPISESASWFDSLDDRLLQGLAGSIVQSQKPVKLKRLIFIGDIHGCIDELQQLLVETDYDRESDLIVSTGDMVNKGPDSAGVLDLLSRERAACVRGNHDNAVLRRLSALHNAGNQNGDSGNISQRSDDQKARVARTLSPSNIAYLQACPIILRVGKVGESDWLVVHGGLVPSVPLEEQIDNYVMNMRTVDPTTHEPSVDHVRPGYSPWAVVWNKYQDLNLSDKLRFAGHRQNVDTSLTTIVYGHDAKQGLQIRKFSKGLDSGCVVGRELTALILVPDGREEIVQVKCKKYTS